MRMNIPGSLVERPIAFTYDFLEVYAGSFQVSAAAVKLGMVVPPGRYLI